jgi:hypothetical protein
MSLPHDLGKVTIEVAKIYNKIMNHIVSLSGYFPGRDTISWQALNYIAFYNFRTRDNSLNSRWVFEAYLQTINPEASYAEVEESIGKLKEDPTKYLEFIIEDEVPALIKQIANYEQYGDVLLSYDSGCDPGYLYVSHEAQTPICTKVTMSDTIAGIASRLRQKIAERKGKHILPDWKGDDYNAGYALIRSKEEYLRILNNNL